MSDYAKLKELAEAIHGKGTTVEMLNRWAAFEAACKPELIIGLITENEQLKEASETLRERIDVQAEANGLLYQNIEVREELCAVLEGNIGHMQKNIDFQKQIIEELRAAAVANKKIQSMQGEMIGSLMAKLGMEAILHA